MAKYPAIYDVSKIKDVSTRQALIAIKQNLELLTGRINVGSQAVTQQDLIDLGLVVRAPNGKLQLPPS